MGVVTGGGGGGTFTGGTIHNPLTVDVGSLASAGGITLQGTSGANVDRFVVDFLHTFFELKGDGNLNLTSDDTLGVAMEGTANSGATLAVTNVPSGDGVSIGSAGLYANIAGDMLLQAVAASGLRFHYNAAPADGSLLPGDGALWVDATNGASKLMVKAMSANGTVVTGSLALA